MALRSDLSGPPAGDTVAPEGLRRTLDSIGLGSSHLRAVWRNGAGGLTFAVASHGSAHPVDFYAKWNPLNTGESLADEAGFRGLREGTLRQPLSR